ncbi:hypothetical protein XELAEV_18013156mg [Xenopus laevis]|uniref:Uncharacterized protein n=1 Tax=Xenopus laevis TaxID=8355 RepID=A0A974DP06_XENLA|nr:hypothetical protein XELAEV_18013156mg [Xenopus laevis]
MSSIDSNSPPPYLVSPWDHLYSLRILFFPTPLPSCSDPAHIPVLFIAIAYSYCMIMTILLHDPFGIILLYHVES